MSSLFIIKSKSKVPWSYVDSFLNLGIRCKNFNNFVEIMGKKKIYHSLQFSLYDRYLLEEGDPQLCDLYTLICILRDAENLDLINNPKIATWDSI
ncbi:MAG: hypothetical protein KAS12_01505 [Candidatus Aenigmarchaeota archaeon]|nr:hypothetical protein [Candidatus Aenigmarchaeota archaeon]